MKKLIFQKFELLTENAEGQLVSGFSDAMESDLMKMGGVNWGCTNNCDGGNCVSGCGSGSGH